MSKDNSKKNYYVYYSYEPWGRGYIGKRECWCLPEEDVKYFGSFTDKTFKPTEKIILETFDNVKDAMQAEVDLHEFYRVDKNPHFANRARATTTKFYYSASGEKNPFYGKRHTEALKRKFSERMRSLGENSHSKTKEFRNMMRELMIKRMKNYGENMENHPSKRLDVRQKISNTLKSLGDDHPSKQPENKLKNSECRKGSKNHFYGKKHTEEARAIISIKNRGRKVDKSVIERRTKSNLKYKYLFISPEGNRYETINANEFCVSNGLNSCGVYQVARGNYSNYRGWKVIRILKSENFTEEIIQKNLSKLDAIIEEWKEKKSKIKDSEETRRKKSLASKGKKKTKESIEKRTKSFCKYTWIFTSPDEKVYEHYNCNEFCREFGLCQVGVGRVARGEKSEYKGWKVTRVLRDK